MADPGEPAPSKGRVLGLDLGQARIGVAISDPERRLALPLGTVHTGAPEDLKALAKIASEHDVTRVVVGLPLRMSGEGGEWAGLAERFADALHRFLGLPVDMQDERLSTVQAERSLGEAAVKGRQRRRVVDQTAAAVILQAYLDRTG